MGMILFLRKLRSLLTRQLCAYGDQGCRNEASAIYSRWMQDPDGYGKCVLFCFTHLKLSKQNQMNLSSDR